MSKTTHNSFEVTEYSKPDMDYAQAAGVIKQIIVDMVHDVPTVGVWSSMTGNQLRLHYHDYVMMLPVHMRETAERSEKTLKELAKHLKSEFKKRTGHTLKLVEKKDLANYTIEKVSLNERYYYKSWMAFELSFS